MSASAKWIKAASISPYRDSTTITATNGKKTKLYKLGSSVKIGYYNATKSVRGKLIKIKNDSLSIQSFYKKSKITKVAITDVSSIAKLHTHGRRGWIPFLSVLILLTIVGAIFLETLPFVGVLALILPIISLYTFIPFLLGSFLADILGTKSAKKGWSFQITP